MYTTKKGQQGEDVLFINEIQSICPFTPALIIGGNLGQTQIIRLPCSTVCPFATLDYGDTVYRILCKGNSEILNLDTIEPIAENNSSKLIKL